MKEVEESQGSAGGFDRRRAIYIPSSGQKAGAKGAIRQV